MEQLEGGPCAVIAPVQAFIIKNLLLEYEGFAFREIVSEHKKNYEDSFTFCSSLAALFKFLNILLHLSTDLKFNFNVKNLFKRCLYFNLN